MAQNWLIALSLRRRDLQGRSRVRAGVIRRAVASLIDVAIATLIPTVGLTIAAAANPELTPVVPMLTFGIAAVLWPFMNILTSWRWHATPGKLVMGLRLMAYVPGEGRIEPPQLAQILLREGLIKAAIPLSFLVWGQVLFAVLVLMMELISLRFRMDRRALHDWRTSTQVIVKKRFETETGRVRDPRARS